MENLKTLSRLHCDASLRGRRDVSENKRRELAPKPWHWPTGTPSRRERRRERRCEHRDVRKPKKNPE